MEILLIRHGQSEANVGQSDHPDCDLTAMGLEQARKSDGGWRKRSFRLHCPCQAPIAGHVEPQTQLPKRQAFAFQSSRRYANGGKTATSTAIGIQKRLGKSFACGCRRFTRDQGREIHFGVPRRSDCRLDASRIWSGDHQKVSSGRKSPMPACCGWSQASNIWKTIEKLIKAEELTGPPVVC